MECRKSFEKAKELLKQSNVLIHYNRSLPIKLAGDASNYGMGCSDISLPRMVKRDPYYLHHEPLQVVNVITH